MPTSTLKYRAVWQSVDYNTLLPHHETLAIFYFQNLDIKPVSDLTYIACNVGVPACVKHLVHLTVCHVEETLQNGLCQPHSSHSQPMSWLNLLLLRWVYIALSSVHLLHWHRQVSEFHEFCWTWFSDISCWVDSGINNNWTIILIS